MPNRTYSEATRQEAIGQVQAGGTAYSVAKSLGISRSNIKRWVKQASELSAQEHTTSTPIKSFSLESFAQNILKLSEKVKTQEAEVIRLKEALKKWQTFAAKANDDIEVLVRR